MKKSGQVTNASRGWRFADGGRWDVLFSGWIGRKRGQVTIFIIVSIMIVSSVMVFFLWTNPTYFTDGGRVKGFEGCVGEVLEEGISELEKSAGFIDPVFSYQYMGEELPYLCYSSDYYMLCTVQVPFLENIFDENLEILIRDDVDACYAASLDDLRAQGYAVTGGDVTYNVRLESGAVRVEIEAPTSVGSSESTRFNVVKSSPIYDMLMIATSIIQFETHYGDSDVATMMLYYPDYYIEKTKRGEGTTVYILENKVFGDKLKFASRSLVFPAGHAIK